MVFINYKPLNIFIISIENLCFSSYTIKSNTITKSFKLDPLYNLLSTTTTYTETLSFLDIEDIIKFFIEYGGYDKNNIVISPYQFHLKIIYRF